MEISWHEAKGIDCERKDSVQKGVQKGEVLKNRLNRVYLCSDCSSEKDGDVVVWMVEEYSPRFAFSFGYPTRGES